MDVDSSSVPLAESFYFPIQEIGEQVLGELQHVTRLSFWMLIN